MKKRYKVYCLFMVWMLTVFLGLPAYAASPLNEEYVLDEAGLLTEKEAVSLQKMAEETAKKYGCGVYIATVQDYYDYNPVSVYEAAKTFYLENDLGIGEEKIGVLLLLSMYERDYAFIAYGSKAHYSFTDYGKEELTEEFLDDFGDDEWYDGFCDYIDECSEYLKKAEAGEPVDVFRMGEQPLALRIGAAMAVAILPAILFGFIAVRSQAKKLHTAHEAATAHMYIAENGAVLTQSQDVFRTVRVTHVDISNDNHGGGGTRIDSGGFSGTSGKF